MPDHEQNSNINNEAFMNDLLKAESTSDSAITETGGNGDSLSVYSVSQIDTSTGR